MKKAFLLLILLFGQYIFGQKYLDTLYNFKIDNENLIWQKVFSTQNNSIKEVFVKSVITNIKKSDLQELEKTLSFQVNGDVIDFKKYGGKWGNTALFVQYPQNYLVVVDFKENRYRVTIKSIESDASSAGVGKLDLSSIVIKRKMGKIKNNKTNSKALKYYDLHFIEKFEIKNKKDEW